MFVAHFIRNAGPGQPYKLGERAFGRHERQDSAGMRLLTAASA
jgi:hypothetical protein